MSNLCVGSEFYAMSVLVHVYMCGSELWLCVRLSVAVFMNTCALKLKWCLHE